MALGIFFQVGFWLLLSPILFQSFNSEYICFSQVGIRPLGQKMHDHENGQTLCFNTLKWMSLSPMLFQALALNFSLPAILCFYTAGSALFQYASNVRHISRHPGQTKDR